VKGAGRYVASVVIVGSLAVAAAVGFAVANLRPLLGLDLVGGVSVVLTAPEGTDTDVVDRTLETIRSRVDAFGVGEPDITRQGELNIQVQIPAVETGTGDRQQRLLELVGRTAQLQFRIVEEIIVPGTPAYDPAEVTEEPAEDEEVVLAGTDGSLVRDTPVEEQPTLYRLSETLMTGERLTRAEATIDPAATGTEGGWQVNFELDSEGSRLFQAITRENVGRELAIVLDQRVESAPTIQDEIPGGSGVITGNFAEQEARDLATVLKTGALPVELEASQVLTVSPTLGRESLEQGVYAAIVGLILLALYLFFYYRLLGIVTWFGMAIWSIFALALVSLAGTSFGYSLTLAGVAGLVVSLGITADSYIVFYERLKDEVRRGKSLRSAVVPAFRRAWRTIVAADIVTIMAAVVLYLLAIGSVRGFALTLGLATALDMFVVYFFKRPAVYLIARSRRLSEVRGLGLRSGVAMDPEPAPVRGGAR
jgi:preprotein translocase subunit SecD